MTLNAAAATAFNYHSAFNESLSLQWNEAATARPRWQLPVFRRSSVLHLTTCRAAAPPDLFLASTSAPNSGNVTGLLISGGAMFFLYLIANFVVPSIIMKDFKQYQTNDETKPEDEIDDDEDDDDDEDEDEDDDE